MKQKVNPLKSNNATKASNLALSGIPRFKVSWSGAEISTYMASSAGFAAGRQDSAVPSQAVLTASLCTSSSTRRDSFAQASSMISFHVVILA